MKTLVRCAAVIFALATVTSADAKGCIKGALVGGIAGHYAGHHGLLGAAGGCIIGRHEANRRAQLKKEQEGQGQGHLDQPSNIDQPKNVDQPK
jgi:hypothetical protein